MSFSTPAFCRFVCLVLVLGEPAAQALAQTPPPDAAPKNSFPVTITVDAGKSLGPLKPIWRFFGADEPNYATMPNGKKLIGELGEMSPDHVYFRAHSLLCTGDGTPALKWGSTNAYHEDAEGKPVYDWTILDEIFDTYRTRGVRPYVQIGFMPRDLSTHPDPYQHHWDPTQKYDAIYTGWTYPPKDYDKWGELVYQWVKHCIDRYTRDEVKTWYFETWNEANGGYWKGTPEEFQKLHDYAVAAVRRALPEARVGGPDAAGSGGDWTRKFLEHQLRGKNYATGEIGTPIDFVSFHAKGSPKQVDGHVQMGIANQLRTIDEGFGIVASFPELADKPIVIGECDPEGCAACQGPQLAYRNGTMYSSYNAATYARIYDLADRRGVNIEGALTWAFEFENTPLFAGYRSLATGGIDLPVLNVFRMMSKMSGDRVEAKSDHAASLDDMLKNGVRDKPDVGALASYDKEKRRSCVLVWHYHDDDLPGPNAEITVLVPGMAPNSSELHQYRIDGAHSNAFAKWNAMGSPQEPTADQYKELIAAGALAEVDDQPTMSQGAADRMLRLTLPRQGVALFVLDWK